jgi:hypothetical protein
VSCLVEWEAVKLRPATYSGEGFEALAGELGSASSKHGGLLVKAGMLTLADVSAPMVTKP